MNDPGAQTASTNGHDLSRWLGIWLHSTNATTSDVMSLISAISETWSQVLNNAQKAQAQFCQSIFEAASPAEIAAAYGTWCLAVATGAIQENQRMLDASVRVLTERAEHRFTTIDPALEARNGTQALAANGSISPPNRANVEGKPFSDSHQRA